jgi:hypothetical protein
MSTTTTTITTPIPGCPNCGGTGVDPDFGPGCACAGWVAKYGQGVTDLRYVGVDTSLLQSERVRDHVAGNGSSSKSTTSNDASEPQLRYMAKLVSERQGVVGEAAAVLARIEKAMTHGLTKRAASEYIDMLMAMPRPTRVTGGTVASGIPGDDGTPPIARPVRRNARPQACDKCGVTVEAEAGALLRNASDTRWIVEHIGECPAVEVVAPVESSDVDLRPMERFTSRGLVRVAVPGGDTRLKLRIKFAKDGTVYVDDAAEYGMGASYGRQRVGESYRGKVAAELAIILADPKAAIIRYTELVGSCAICNRHLEAGESVEQGLGPVCRKKLGM